MSQTYRFPAKMLDTHTAVLGKTGSGKTITAKLMIEQLVPQHDRVCILDPIKSDYRGLVSSADGRQPGLPFYILGGPFGHVPLHPGAGKAIAEIVANGNLPLSILDMKEFPAGGLYEFFSDFAPVLLSKIRGILYLVMEEAHLFAPKERSGIAKENYSIHWSKQIANAGRSAGVRLIVTTQRTQMLHNSILGACDSLIAHRLIAPADQEPVLRWLRTQAGKEQMEEVQKSLAGLEKGEAWICSPEAKVFERRQMPMIWTFDNTKTPSRKDVDRQRDRVVATAEVDLDKLKSVIGEAVAVAEANDPKKLRAEIADLKAKLARAPLVAKGPDPRIESLREAGRQASASLKGSAAENRELRRMLEEAMKFLVKINANDFFGAGPVDQGAVRTAIEQAVERSRALIEGQLQRRAQELRSLRERAEALTAEIERALRAKRDVNVEVEVTHNKPFTVAARPERAPSPRPTPNGDSSGLPVGEAKILAAAIQFPDGLRRDQLSVLCGYKRSSRDTYIQRLRERGLVETRDDGIVATPEGIATLPDAQPLPTGAELQQYWMGQLPTGEARILQVLIDRYPEEVARDELDAATGFQRSSRDTYLQRLAARQLVDRGRGGVRASANLFGGEQE